MSAQTILFVIPKPSSPFQCERRIDKSATGEGEHKGVAIEQHKKRYKMERNPRDDDHNEEDYKKSDGDNYERVMVEDAFKDTVVPPWTKQITIRSMVTSFILSIVFNFIVCKLNLTTGVIPSLNVAAGLLGFAVVKGYTTLLEKCGLLNQPFSRQENTVIQTCVVASSGIAFSSMFSQNYFFFIRF